MAYIAIDFDGTLAHTLGPVIDAYNAEHGAAHGERFGRPLCYEDCTAWDMTTYTLSDANIYQHFASHDLRMQAPPLADAQRVTEALVRRGDHLIVMTDSVMIWTIQQYLKQHFPHITEVWRIPSKRKAYVAAATGHSMLIDDHYDNVQGHSIGWLIDAPYNQQPHRRRLGSWQGNPTPWAALAEKMGVLL